MKHGVALGCVVTLSLLASTVAAWPRDIEVEPATAPKRTRSVRKSTATPPLVPVTPLIARPITVRPLERPSPGLSRPDFAPPPAPPPTSSATATPTATSAPPPPPTSSAAPTPTSSATATATATPTATSAPTAPPPPSSGLGGNYTIKGQGNDGSKYAGSATLSLIGGHMYKASWSIGATKFTGVCFKETTTLACGWSTKARDANVISYLIDSSLLDGVWFEDGGTKLGKEKLTPVGKLKPNLAGDYTITTGDNPDGSKYTGTSKLTNVSAVCDTCYTLAWKIGGSSVSGVGVRAPGDQPVLAVGYADGGTTYGALQYQISVSGKVLTGTWIQTVNSVVSAGAETMTKL